MKHSFDSFDQILIFQNFCFHPSVEFVLLFPHWEDLCICVHVCISDIWVNGVCHQETSGWQDQPSRRDRPRLPPSFLGRQAEALPITFGIVSAIEADESFLHFAHGIC